ncbi:hypothetical protein FOA52_006053 [Chlamydomonas sp. UWO 241]|nr:hypothetical protein FOA52_006053 [Chlamydomonas sp. UWO 241]
MGARIPHAARGSRATDHSRDEHHHVRASTMFRTQSAPDDADTDQQHFRLPKGPGQDATAAEKMKHDLNKQALEEVYKTFLDADTNGSGQLDVSEFVDSFAGILQTEEGDDEDALSKLFTRIDANSDGTISWDEFSSYMLLESTGMSRIRELESHVTFSTPEKPTNPPVADSQCHKEIVQHISSVTLASGADRYVTCGRDGMVRVWNPNTMEHLKSVNCGKSWVTDALMLPLTQKLAVCTFARTMKVYDPISFELCGQIQEIEYAPMAMAAWVSPLRDCELVAFGDGGGYVRMYEVTIDPLEDKSSNDRYISALKWKHLHHRDWVSSVAYVEEMNCIVAGSLDKTISMTDVEERVPLKLLEGHTKGVTSVTWSKLYKFVCSGGQDRKVILWNPFSQKPLAILEDHTAPVMQVIVSDRDNQIISLTSDKVVKIWDIRNHKCLQTVQDRETYKKDDTLLTMAFDCKRKRLITANLAPKVWTAEDTTTTNSAHQKPVAKVLFNALFNEAVSADHAGTVSVWHVPTGKLRFRFYEAHGEAKITAMAFDLTQRRLLTGSENGEVKVWNFSSGSCLARLHPRSSQQSAASDEVTSLLAVHGQLMRHFLVAGWDRQITFYDDDPAESNIYPGRRLSGSESDILDMVLMDRFPTLVTACYGGEIWAWNLDSGAPRRAMFPRRAGMAPSERACEAVTFLNGPALKSVLLSVYADRYLRVWEVHGGTLLLELFTGHKLGETVIGLAVDSTNQLVATADSAGFIKMWDASGFRVTKEGDVPGLGVSSTGTLREMWVWRSHARQVCNLEWLQLPEGKFLLSGSHDHDVKLWTPHGVLVGTFGHAQWCMDDLGTWAASERKPLEEMEAYEMSHREPKTKGGQPSTRHLSKQYTFVGALDATEEEEMEEEEGPAVDDPFDRAGTTGRGHDGTEPSTLTLAAASAASAPPATAAAAAATAAAAAAAAAAALGRPVSAAVRPSGSGIAGHRAGARVASARAASARTAAMRPPAAGGGQFSEASTSGAGPQLGAWGRFGAGSMCGIMGTGSSPKKSAMRVPSALAVNAPTDPHSPRGGDAGSGGGADSPHGGGGGGVSFRASFGPRGGVSFGGRGDGPANPRGSGGGAGGDTGGSPPRASTRFASVLCKPTSSAAHEQRPGSAMPADVAQLLEATHRERLLRVGSARRYERNASRASSFASSAGRASFAAPASEASFRQDEGVGEDDGEDDGEGSEEVVESEPSSEDGDAIDVAVPKLLWLTEFDKPARGGAAASAVPGAHGVYAQLAVSEPAPLPDRPSPSSARGL